MSDRHLAFLVDTTRCINCKTCEIACKDINGAGPGVRLRKVRSFESGEFPVVIVINISMSCNHCEDPLCVAECPARAYHKRSDGVVIHDANKCIGCRYCTWVCPYGAPQYDEENGCIRKCDFCASELEVGRLPACVEACPTRAMSFGWSDELSAKDATINVKNVPAPSITRPGTRYRVRREGRYD